MQYESYQDGPESREDIIRTIPRAVLKMDERRVPPTERGRKKP